VRTRWARRMRAVNTLQQLLSRRRSVIDAVKTLWERRVDAVGTLWGRCVHVITGKFDILIFWGVFRGDPTARWQVFRTLYKRCGIAVWYDRGLILRYCLVRFFLSQLGFAEVNSTVLKVWISQVHKKPLSYTLFTFFILYDAPESVDGLASFIKETPQDKNVMCWWSKYIAAIFLSLLNMRTSNVHIYLRVQIESYAF